MANISTRRSVSGESYWCEQIALCEGSGKSITQYCRDECLSAGKYYWWKAELRRRGVLQPVATRFAEVRVVAPEIALPEAARLEVALAGDRCVRVWPGFDSETLSRVVRALEDVSC